MAQKRHRVDQIISKLRRADVELGNGKKVPEFCKLNGISGQTCYHWRLDYKHERIYSALDYQAPAAYVASSVLSASATRPEHSRVN